MNYQVLASLFHFPHFGVEGLPLFIQLREKLELIISSRVGKLLPSGHIHPLLIYINEVLLDCNHTQYLAIGYG